MVRVCCVPSTTTPEKLEAGVPAIALGELERAAVGQGDEIGDWAPDLDVLLALGARCHDCRGDPVVYHMLGHDVFDIETKCMSAPGPGVLRVGNQCRTFCHSRRFPVKGNEPISAKRHAGQKHCNDRNSCTTPHTDSPLKGRVHFEQLRPSICVYHITDYVISQVLKKAQ